MTKRTTLGVVLGFALLSLGCGDSDSGMGAAGSGTADSPSLSGGTGSPGVTASIEGGMELSFADESQLLAAYYTQALEPFPAGSMAVLAGGGGAESVMISFAGDAPGEYDVAMQEVLLAVEDASGMYVGGRGVGTGSVSVTAVGSVGELVEGSFDVMANVWDAAADGPGADQVQISGSFRVERSPDDFDYRGGR